MPANDIRVRAEDLPELIAGIYRETLRDDSLGVDNDFFESGGDSLAAFEITAQLGAVLGVEVPVALVFAFPTPADLASVVELDNVAAG